MARYSRKNLASEFMHIMVQGINKEYIFQENQYKKVYQKLLKEKKENYNIEIIAYCIMDNHAHILMYSRNINEISKFMMRVNTAYARWYNNQKERVGYVFRDRYKSEPILDYHHLYSCIVYIHNNPVKAKMVSSPEKYKYSSYRDFLNKQGFLNSKILKLIDLSEKGLEKTIISSKDFDINGFYQANPQNVIEKFFAEKNVKSIKKINDKRTIKELVDLLKEDCNLTYIEIANELKMSRSTIYRYTRDN